MPEAVRLTGPDLRALAAHELLAHERRQLTANRSTLDAEHLDRADVEHLAFNRPAFEDAPLGDAQLIETRREQRSDRRR